MQPAMPCIGCKSRASFPFGNCVLFLLALGLKKAAAINWFTDADTTGKQSPVFEAWTPTLMATTLCTQLEAQKKGVCAHTFLTIQMYCMQVQKFQPNQHCMHNPASSTSPRHPYNTPHSSVGWRCPWRQWYEQVPSHRRQRILWLIGWCGWLSARVIKSNNNNDTDINK